MNNTVMMIAEIRKIVTLAIVVYIFYTVAIPAINVFLFAEQIANDAIQTGIDTANTITGWFW